MTAIGSSSQTYDDAGELIRRFDRAPKPMAYSPDFLLKAWHDYLAETGLPEARVDPDAFIRWTYGRALAHRQPRYAKMAERWGLAIPAEALSGLDSAADFEAVVAEALDAALGKSRREA